MSDEKERLVAEVYIEAVGAGDPPVKAVAETFGVPVTTARHWVIAVRRAGRLAPVRKGVDLSALTRQCPTCGASPSRWRRG